MTRLPYVFSFSGMILFFIIWKLVHGPNYNDIWTFSFLLSVLLARFVQSSFMKSRRGHHIFWLGLLSAIINFIGVAVVFSAASFVSESASSGLLQWGVLRYYPLWLFYVGIPLVIIMGVFYGVALTFLSKREQWRFEK